jgi:uncharacterized DUF497 family protein
VLTIGTRIDIFPAKRICWNPEKNEWLKEARGVCFEQVADILEQEDELDVIDHPNQEKYPQQKIIVVNINDYAYLIPRVENRGRHFPKDDYSQPEDDGQIFEVNYE